MKLLNEEVKDMASNLPPGCGSYDGIDHEFESAIEALVDRIKDARTAQMLINFLDAVEATYRAGYTDGQMDKSMEQGSREEPRCRHGVRFPHE
ncbi:MAG: hypothetical protein WC132_06105 [Methanomethylophilus sp.]